jgi:hypothetical protein
MNEFDEDENDERRSKPEEVTVNLVNSFLDHVLHRCLRQDPTRREEIRLRIERKTSSIFIADVRVSAEDDGGICRVVRDRAQGWHEEDSFLAFIEAKKAFQHIDDSKHGKLTPVVSNETLSQYLGEAVIIWKANPDLRQRG